MHYTKELCLLKDVQKRCLVKRAVAWHACVMQVRCHWTDFGTSVAIVATRHANTEGEVIRSTGRQEITKATNPCNMIGWIEICIDFLRMTHTGCVEPTPLSRQSLKVAILSKCFQKSRHVPFFVHHDTKLIIKQFCEWHVAVMGKGSTVFVRAIVTNSEHVTAQVSPSRVFHGFCCDGIWCCFGVNKAVTCPGIADWRKIIGTSGHTSNKSPSTSYHWLYLAVCLQFKYTSLVT